MQEEIVNFIWEKLLAPAALTLLFSLLSGGFVAFMRTGFSTGMRIFLRCAVLCAASITYSMAWHDELQRIFKFEDAWAVPALTIAVTVSLFGWRSYNKQLVEGNAEDISRD